jgi:hypothetical protein
LISADSLAGLLTSISIFGAIVLLIGNVRKDYGNKQKNCTSPRFYQSLNVRI